MDASFFIDYTRRQPLARFTAWLRGPAMMEVLVGGVLETNSSYLDHLGPIAIDDQFVAEL